MITFAKETLVCSGSGQEIWCSPYLSPDWECVRNCIVWFVSKIAQVQILKNFLVDRWVLSFWHDVSSVCRCCRHCL